MSPKRAKTTKKLGHIEVSMENKSCSAIQVDPKNVFVHYTNLKNSPLGPPKAKTTQKLGQNKKVRIDGSIENKSFTAI